MTMAVNKKNRGCAYGIIGTIVVILGVVASYLLIASLSRLFTGLRLGSAPFAVIMPGYIVFLIIQFVLFEVIFMLMMPDGIMSGKGESEEVKKRNGLIAKIISIVCGVAAVFVIFIAANWFTAWTDTGIRDSKLFQTEEFSFEDASSARVYYGSNGLAFSVTSKSGKSYELFSGVGAFNDAFATEYENQYNYAVQVKKMLTEAGVEVIVQDAEKLKRVYEEPYPKTWEYIKQLIDDPENEGNQ